MHRVTRNRDRHRCRFAQDDRAAGAVCWNIDADRSRIGKHERTSVGTIDDRERFPVGPAQGSKVGRACGRRHGIGGRGFDEQAIAARSREGEAIVARRKAVGRAAGVGHGRSGDDRRGKCRNAVITKDVGGKPGVGIDQRHACAGNGRAVAAVEDDPERIDQDVDGGSGDQAAVALPQAVERDRVPLRHSQDAVAADRRRRARRCPHDACEQAAIPTGFRNRQCFRIALLRVERDSQPFCRERIAIVRRRGQGDHERLACAYRCGPDHRCGGKRGSRKGAFERDRRRTCIAFALRCPDRNSFCALPAAELIERKRRGRGRNDLDGQIYPVGLLDDGVGPDRPAQRCRVRNRLCK